MAAIRFTCPSCSRTLEIDESSVEDEVEFGACRHVFVPVRPRPRLNRMPNTTRQRSEANDRVVNVAIGPVAQRPLSQRCHDDDDDDDDDDEYYSPRRGLSRDREERGGTSNTATLSW